MYVIQALYTKFTVIVFASYIGYANRICTCYVIEQWALLRKQYTDRNTCKKCER